MASLFARALVSTVIAVALQGCGGGDGPPAVATLKIAPDDGSTVVGEPAAVAVTVPSGQDPSAMTVLLDGRDITSKFGEPDGAGTRKALLSRPVVRLGKNQIQVRYGQDRSNSSFFLDPARPADPDGAARTGVLPPKPEAMDGRTSVFTPVRTRVLRSGGNPAVATDWGIQVGGNTYYSNTPEGCSGSSCSAGMQLLFLDRSDLSVVSNTSYATDQVSEIVNGGPLGSALLGAAGGTPGCEQSGCILVMQSLGLLGVTVCPTGGNCAGDPLIVFYQTGLERIGASGSIYGANGMSPKLAYSFIGNVGSGKTPQASEMAGTQYERLGCSGDFTGCGTGNGSFSPQANSPDDPTRTGAISGAFVRDNWNSFTFAPTAPPIVYTFGNGPNSSGTLRNTVSLNGSTTEGQGLYSLDLPAGVSGGFRLLILDRTNPGGPNAKQFDQFFDMSQLADLAYKIIESRRANSLYFLASMGKVSHNLEHANTAPTWDLLSLAVESIGGDRLTFKILGDTHPAFDPNGTDDYLLIGRPTMFPVAGEYVQPFYGAEAGTVMTKHTVSGATGPTSVQGLLTQDLQGYYAPRLQGSAQDLLSPRMTALLHSAMLPASPWPYTGYPQHQAAYVWLSNAICCADVRATYSSENAVPSNWLFELQQQKYPYSSTDPNPPFTLTDFNDMKQQLETEIEYLSQVQTFYNNIKSLYQYQQDTLSTILQAVSDEVLSDLYSNSPPPVPPSPWRAFTEDVFPTLANLVGFAPVGPAIQTALGVGTMVIDSALDRANDANGNSQLVQQLAAQEVAAANVATFTVTQYNDSLAAMANDFDRIVADWGRLQAVAGPLSRGEVPWDATANANLDRAFNLAARRQFYPALMSGGGNFTVTHVKYAEVQYYGSDDDGAGCDLSRFAKGQDEGDSRFAGVGWYPGVLQNANPYGDRNPNSYWWDMWGLVYNSNGSQKDCPDPVGYGPLPNTFGMFTPFDPEQPTYLGLWKPHFFQRSGINIHETSSKYYTDHLP